MSAGKPSKSALKREHLALQALGAQLIGLSAEQLASLSLDERLLDAVQKAQGMQAHGALRRQKQLIGKLMRQVDAEPIRRALDAVNRSDRLTKQIFSESERWRDRIASEGSGALREFCDLIGAENRELEQLLQAYAAAHDEKTRRTARRRIFSEVHSELAARMQATPR